MWGLYQTALDVKDWLTDANRLPMSELLLQGQHQYLQTDELRSAVLDGAELRNFFELDVNELQARLNALPWVAQVSVRKKWPNKIKVYLTEQAVAARWNGNRFVNTKGEVFSAPDRVKTPLMQLSGQKIRPSRCWRPAANTRRSWRPEGTSCWGESDPRHAWELTLDGNIQLFWGARISRFDCSGLSMPFRSSNLVSGLLTWIFDTTPEWQLAGRRTKRK